MAWRWPVLGSLALAISAALAAWLAHGWAIGQPVLMVWAASWLLLLRTPPGRRHQHVLLLLVMVLLALAASLVLAVAADDYAAWAAVANAQWAGPLQWLNLGLPPTLAAAGPLLGVLFLVLCVLVKAPLVSALAFTTPVGLAWAAPVFQLAYRPRGERWWLAPSWRDAQALGVYLALLGLVAWAALWWTLSQGSVPPWWPLLPAALLPLGIEWLWWLSGEVDQRLEPTLGGRDDGARESADFDDLWRRYRQRWPQLWRAAGNRVPEPPHG